MTSPNYWIRLHRPHRMEQPLDCVDQLAGILDEPASAGPGSDWGVVGERLGAALPADYRRFIDKFGAGTVGALRVFAPDAPAPEFDLFGLVERVGREAEEFRASTMPEFGGPYHPQRGGLIPWGEMDGGLYFSWIPAGPDPDVWPVAISDPSWLGTYMPDKSFSLFLADYLAGKNAGSGAPLLSPDEGVGARFVPAS
ncbi:hypothetical protein AB0425_39340 [Actinosynnema sp. NPDC051121]